MKGSACFVLIVCLAFLGCGDGDYNVLSEIIDELEKEMGVMQTEIDVLDTDQSLVAVQEAIADLRSDVDVLKEPERDIETRVTLWEQVYHEQKEEWSHIVEVFYTVENVGDIAINKYKVWLAAITADGKRYMDLVSGGDPDFVRPPDYFPAPEESDLAPRIAKWKELIEANDAAKIAAYSHYGK